MRLLVGIAICLAGVGGCSALFDGSDLHGKSGDMSTGGDGDDMGAGDVDMAGGGGGGGGGGGPLTTVAFTAQTPIAVGANPYDISAGDFDGDGKLDAVTANDGDDNVTFLFGDGSGHLSAVNIAVPPAANGCDPYAITSGRLDGDGSDDVVVTCTDVDVHNHVYTVLGSSARSFTPVEIAALASDTSTATKPEGVALGDFNKDGKLDVATANAGVAQVWVVAGNGDGTFAATANKLNTGATSSYPIRVVAGDFNKDGRDDIAAGDYELAQLYVFAQTTTPGTFSAPVIYNTVNSVNGMTAADFDGNGHLDLVTADAHNDAVAVLVADATGAFPAATGTKQPPEYPVHPSPSGIVTGDFNRDGKLDLVVANANSPGGSIDVLLGKGDGSFDNAIPIGNSATPINIVVADFNGDGLPDFAVANNAATPTATVYLNSSH
jgi:hypothetical protein